MFSDKTLETSTTTGTGTFNLAGAPSGYRTFVAGIGSGSIAFYIAQDSADSTIWEVGYGTVTDASPDTLTRNLLASSTGSLINWAAGTRNIWSYGIGAALASLVKGNASATGRPGWLPSGAMWIDTSATPWVWYVFDGTDNIQIATINATSNVLTLKGITDLLATANTWTADQTIQSSDAGALGPQLNLAHNTASQAVSDEVARLNFIGRDSAGNPTQYGSAVVTVVDPTNTSEDGRFQLRTMQAGTEQDCMLLGLGGWMRTATGGDPGAGKFNAVELQQQGQPVQRKLGWAMLYQLVASGTAGGTTVSTTWTKMPLNSEDGTDGFVTFSDANDNFTLPAGTYKINGWARFNNNGNEPSAGIRLQNTTDATTPVLGSGIPKMTNGVDGVAFIKGQFTIAATKTFEFQYWVSVGQTDFGLGRPASTGSSEIYRELEIERWA